MVEDVHIYLAQQLIQRQFPSIGGLQSTLLRQNDGFIPVRRTQKYLQIHHVTGNHWVTTSFQGGEDDEVSLYDSKFSG